MNSSNMEQKLIRNNKGQRIIEVSLELVEVFNSQFECLLCVAINFFVFEISSHDPAVLHVRKLESSNFVSSKFLLQFCNYLSSNFDIGRIVLRRIQKCRSIDRFRQLYLISSEEFLQPQGWMHTCNADNAVELSRQFEARPYSPTKSYQIEFLMPVSCQMLRQRSKSFSCQIEVLRFDVLHDCRPQLAFEWI